MLGRTKVECNGFLIFISLCIIHNASALCSDEFMTYKKFQQGLVKRHPDGFGFFIPDDKTQPDVYIPKNSMTGVMSNDKVLVDVVPEKGTDRYRGDVVKMIARFHKKIVGRFENLNNKMGVIRDDSYSWGSDLYIKLEDTMGAKPGELVAAEIITYQTETEKFSGKVVEIIGDSVDPINDIKRVIFSNNIPFEFSAATQKEASQIPHEVFESEFKNRKDLRKLPLITIDGKTAKDFDDAVFTETTNQGFHLYVAIADVSHYVNLGSAIDKDAYERGTSVYFPNFVVPMLPEVLSNELCSLKPNVPRLCLVAEMTIDFSGTVTQSEFYEAVMQSQARVTYGEAQEIVDGKDIEKFNHVKDNILRSADLAKLLMAKRFREGALDLEIPETILEIDASGVPVDVLKTERLFAHRLIEELMLIANIETAKFLASKDIPAIYRVHDEPRAEAIKILQKYLHNFGSQVKFGGGMLQKKLTKALEEFHGKPEAQVLNILTLRSMSQAKYSTDNIGHFGLGFPFYTHFTSPIRRYPDLIAHRLIKNQILTNSKYRLIPEDELTTACNMLSGCEQRSVKAERQLMSIKKARFMEKHIGKEFDGVISSVTKFGMFVLLREFDIDGLVKMENLGNDYFEYNEENLTLIGKRTKQVFAIGDVVQVVVTSANSAVGQIDFSLKSVTEAKRKPQSSASQPQSEKQHQHQQPKKSGTQTQKSSKPKSLKDVLDRKGKKDGFTKDKSADRKNSQKRKPNEDDRGGFRKARVSKNSRKNKAR